MNERVQEEPEARRWSFRRVFAVAMVVVLVLLSIVVVIEIARDGSAKDPPPTHRTPSTGFGATYAPYTWGK